ncbi:MAG: hypothetical protein PHI00_09470 [Atribacterota bacterium]|nr:hypothetical protein [Atribacterota bacterium]
MRYLLKTRREIVYEASKGYKKLSKKEKTERLDNLVAITGYNRDYICDYSPSMIGVFM